MEKHKNPEENKSLNNNLVYKILKIVLICLVIFCFLLMCLYIMGNFQLFQDRSQGLILKVLSYTAIFTGLLTIPILIENVIMLFTENKKWKSIISIILLLLCIVFCVICLGISNIVIFLSEGI